MSREPAAARVKQCVICRVCLSMLASAERDARRVARGPRTCEIRCRGFTLLELMLVVAVLGTLSALAIPYYFGYLEKARVARAISEIRSFERAIDIYEFDTGAPPDTLVQAGISNPLDPWGNPYQYLKLSGGPGGPPGGGPGGPPGGGPGGPPGPGVWFFILPSVAYAQGGSPPMPRKDRFLVPINSDYDLYSKGKDGESKAPLSPKVSHDDIIRANDGAFVGLASEF